LKILNQTGLKQQKKVKGFVHDMSSTGHTLFIEPEEVLELNNELREYQHLERREINKILIHLTSHVGIEGAGLSRLSYFLGRVDFIRAKARFALKLEAQLPDLIKDPIVDWKNARHPLLDISFKTQQKSLVAQSFKISDKNRLVLVSGPNAGGKSVCLKTLGLIQYMAQSGLLIPVDESSKLGIFESMFIDIGDEQSLENDLSTYSSHLINMKQFMEHSDVHSLILIDEFGTGTDPGYGGAIAEAVLVNLIKNRAKGMITTHYGNLKQFANRHEGVVNGAMQFDTVKLEPRYKMVVGKPGSSFALEIAQKIGLGKKIIQKAKEIIGEEKVQLDELISSLEKEKIHLEEELSSSNRLNNQLEKEIKKYRDLKEKLEDEEDEILDKAKEEARQLLKEANVLIEKTIREIKEHAAEKVSTKKSRDSLKSFAGKIRHKSNRERKQKQSKEIVIGGKIRENDRVRITGQETKGTVLRIMGKDAEILIGELRSTIRLSRLEKLSSGNPEKKGFGTKKRKGLDLHRKMTEFKPDIDIRGKRVEEVLPVIEKYMDNALLFNASRLRIVHGKGNGVLREVVRNHLKSYPGVRKVTDEHADRGGDGVTIVELG